MGFGAWLKARREEAGLTQDEFGDAIGISKSMVSQIETGRVGKGQKPWRPQPDAVKEMARALRAAGVPVSTAEAFRAAGFTAENPEVEAGAEAVPEGPALRGELLINLEALRHWSIEVDGSVLRIVSNHGRGRPRPSMRLEAPANTVDPSLVAAIDAGDMEAVEELAAVPPS